MDHQTSIDFDDHVGSQYRVAAYAARITERVVVNLLERLARHDQKQALVVVIAFVGWSIEVIATNPVNIESLLHVLVCDGENDILFALFN